MADAPGTHTITQVFDDGKVLVAGFDKPLALSPKQTATQGQEVRGWVNPDGQYGPYLKVAKDRPQGSSNSSTGQVRDDATGRSIERQVAAKAAAEMTAVIGGPAPEMVQNFNGLFDAVLSRIQDIGGGGASSEQGKSDEPGIAPAAAPSAALSPERAEALEQSIASAGMTKDEVRILLGATGVSVGDDLYAAIASMTPEQASSIESFVETKKTMATA